MLRIVIFSILTLVGCGESSYTQLTTICSQRSIGFQDSHMICGALEECVTGDTIQYYRYLCFCDIICMCFYSESNCVNNKDCDIASTLMLFGDAFCDLSESRRKSLVFDIKRQVEEVYK